ncbi:hypothetical protein [Bacteroides nordii]|uniref:hypothetical protein n=1 Tax=Bacteroides nordii TaxID=291645 RepID=UPI0026DAFC6A|nr:hypothetical protein [Bacteroides nordii]
MKLFICFLLITSNLFTQVDRFYYTSYNDIDSILSGKKEYSLKEAIFAVENAYFEGRLNREDFEHELQQFVSFAKSLSTNNLISYNHTDFPSVNIHAAIFRMMTDTIPVYISDTTVLYHLPFQYNFDDYAGKREWSNMFVSTLMTTHKGNCHSLPLFYKLLTEEIGEKSWLALAPNHAYIKLQNQANGWYNVELTSGQFPTDVWIKASGYIHTDAIRNGIYMDTLSLKSTIAVCMTDLAEGYKHKFAPDYDPEFILKCCNRTLEVFPNYMNALLLKAETLFDIYTRTKREEYYQDAEILYSHIHQLGYRKMPEKMYTEWLQSLKKSSDPPINKR